MKKNLVGVIGLAAVLATSSAWAVVVETTNVVVSSESTLGIRRTICDLSTPSEIAIGVPWLDFNTNSITISELLTTGQLTNNDSLKAFDRTNKTYWVWQWKNEKWNRTYDTTLGRLSPDPATFKVDRGTGLWLVRSYPTNTFTQAGLYTTIPATNQVNNLNSKGEKGTASDPVYTLLFSPRNVPFDLAELKSEDGCSSNDRVVIPSLGLNYSFRKTSKIDSWGMFVNGKWTAQTTLELPVNTAIWYLSAGGNPKFVW